MILNLRFAAVYSMKVSVVIPAYNEEDFLPQCLESLLSQEVPPDEIIVVDNNSVDATAEIARKYGVRVVKEKKQGMIFARNRGFNLARYDIIARCDADSIVSPQWIGQIKKAFAGGDIIAMSGPCYFYDLQRFRKFKKAHKLFLKAVYFRPSRIMLGHDVLFGSSMALLKAGWLKVKNEVCMNDRAVHEDMDLTIHLKPHGRIKFDPRFVAAISARRLRSPKTLVDYPTRWVKSLRHARKMKKAANRRNNS